MVLGELFGEIMLFILQVVGLHSASFLSSLTPEWPTMCRVEC